MSDEREEPKSGSKSAEHSTARPQRGRALRWLLLVLCLLALGVACVVRYTQGAGFHEGVRRWQINAMQRATGARVELQSVHWDLLRAEYELDGLTLHGREAAADPPLLQVRELRMRLRWNFLLGRGVRLRELVITEPRARVVVNRDGSTNLPEPVRARPTPTPEELMRMIVDRAMISDGLLVWNDRALRLDGRAEGIRLVLRYISADHHYDGNFTVGSVRLVPQAEEPFTLAADAAFRLYRDHVDVPHLRVTQGHSAVDASGVVTTLASPEAQFSYRATADLGELGRLMRLRQLRAGAVQLTGEGVWRRRGGYAIVGRAQGTGMEWRDSILQLQHISGGLEFSLDRERFSIPALFAVALGGSVHGKLLAAGPESQRQDGRIHLDVSGLELKQVLAAFSEPELPLHSLPLGGAATGTLEIHWAEGLQHALMDGDVKVRPVQRPGELPVSAAVRATVDFLGQSAQFPEAEATTPASRVSVHGRISANSDLKIDLTSDSFAELAPLVADWRGSRARVMPIEFHGPAQFHGEVHGLLIDPALSGHLELRDFTTLVHARDAGPAGDGPVHASQVLRNHWDDLEGDVEYSPTLESLRNAVLRHGNARFQLDVTVPLVDGDYDGQQPFAAHIRAENADASEIASIGGWDYPITGVVSGEVQVGGTEGHLNGSGHLAVRNGSAWGQAIHSATTDLGFAAEQAQFRNIVVRSDAMQLTGEASINVETSQFGFHLIGSEVRLEQLHGLQNSRMRLTGQAAFEATGSGTPSAPVVNGRLRLRNLALNSRPLGNVNVEAVTHGAEMTVSARSDSSLGDFRVDGQVRLRDQMPMHFTADANSANLNPLLEALLPARYSAPSELKLHAEISGEARHARDLTAEVTAEHWSTGYAGIAVANDGPIQLRLANGILSVEQFRVAGEQGTRFLQVRGRVELTGRQRMDVHATGNINLKLLETTDPSLTSAGVADLNLAIGGTMERPAMSGRLEVHNGSIAYIDFPNGLSDINGTLTFNEDRLLVEQLTARTGGALLQFGGFLTFSPAQGFGVNLSASGHDIRLRYPEGLSSTADAALTLTGTLRNALLSGNVTITRIGLNPQFDFASYLMRPLILPSSQQIDSPLNGIHLDVRVASTPELQVQTTLARLSGNVDLRIRGTAARPVALGRVNLLEGQIYFNATKYRLERGDITLTNPVRIEPTLDVELTARVRDYDITLGLHGPLDHLTPSYRSDPPLSTSDIISLLALGRTAEESANPAMLGSAQYSPSVSESASTALIGQALNSTVTNRVQKLFGVSRIKIDPNVGSSANAGLARVTVEQQVSNKLTLTYITNLSQSAQQIIQFEYNLDKDLSLVGIRDQNGVLSVDLLLRKRHK